MDTVHTIKLKIFRRFPLFVDFPHFFFGSDVQYSCSTGGIYNDLPSLIWIVLPTAPPPNLTPLNVGTQSNQYMSPVQRQGHVTTTAFQILVDKYFAFVLLLLTVCIGKNYDYITRSTVVHVETYDSNDYSSVGYKY